MIGLELVNESLTWLREHYFDYDFYYERDIVWTVQCQLNRRVRAQQLKYRVCNDVSLLPPRRTDIGLMNEDSLLPLEIAIEFKYEPAHSRVDITKTKFPVCFWDKEGVLEDTRRVREFVTQCKAKVAVAVLIDEGGYFAHRPAPIGSAWEEWDGGVRVLRTVATG